MRILGSVWQKEQVAEEKDTKLDMERLGMSPKRKPAKVIDFKAYVHRK